MFATVPGSSTKLPLVCALAAIWLLPACDRALGLDEFNEATPEAGASGGGSGGGSGGAAGSPVMPPPGFVRVSPGAFTMGSPPGEPGRAPNEWPHEVTITQPFLIQVTEVTQKDWFDLTGTRPSFFANCGEDCPVEMVSWYDAVAFCNAKSATESLAPCYWAGDTPYAFEHANARIEPAWPEGLSCNGYRLPTEAEWEYAARAGSESAFHTGDIAGAACVDPAMSVAGWFCGNSTVTYAGCEDATESGGAACAGPHPVGLLQANDLGLTDVHGNVWEWVWDWYADYPGNQVDPLGPPNGDQRVGRGGYWYATAGYCRAAKRLTGDPGGRGNHIGFRIARTAP